MDKGVQVSNRFAGLMDGEKIKPAATKCKDRQMDYWSGSFVKLTGVSASSMKDFDNSCIRKKSVTVGSVTASSSRGMGSSGGMTFTGNADSRVKQVNSQRRELKPVMERRETVWGNYHNGMISTSTGENGRSYPEPTHLSLIKQNTPGRQWFLGGRRLVNNQAEVARGSEGPQSPPDVNSYDEFPCL